VILPFRLGAHVERAVLIPGCRFVRPRGVALVVLAVAACGTEAPGEDDDPSSSGTFMQRDSAGVVIATTLGEAAWAVLDWEVDSLPDLDIGSGESEQQTLFQVEGVRGLTEGGVAVVDGGSREIRYYDPQGQPLYNVGGEGEGPGEFRQPVYVLEAGSDSLLFWDRRLRRFQLFSEDGRFHRTVTVSDRRAISGLIPIGAAGPRILLRDWEPSGMIQAGIHGVRGTLEEGWHLIWFDPSTGGQVSAAHLSFSTLHGVPEGAVDIPFTIPPSVAVNRKGVFLTDGRPPEIQDIGTEGRLRRIFRVEGPLRPVTNEIKESDLKRRMDETPWGLWSDWFAEMDLPDSLPVFESLQIDDIGWLWAKVYHPNPTQSPEWMVFDPDGRAHGVLQAPDGLEIHHIGTDFILGVWHDELGVEFVHRHILRRRVVGPTHPGLN